MGLSGLFKKAGCVAALCMLSVMLEAAPYDDMIDGCKKGDATKVQAAIAAGAGVNALDEGGNPPLTTAIFREDIVDILLKAGANPNLGKLTPLYNAAGNNCAKTVQLLLAAGADPNNAQMPGSYPLEYAITQTDNADVVKLLIDAGARTDIMSSAGGNLAYVWADSPNPADKLKGSATIAGMLEKSYGFIMPDWCKDQGFNHDTGAVLKLLIDKKVDINAPVAKEGSIVKGWTPLLAALRVERPEKARLLAANGADVKTPVVIFMPKLSYHPVCLAAERGDAELVRLMIEKGADVNVVAEPSALLGNSGITKCEGLTPLNIALMFGKADAAKQLLAAGADPKAGVSGYVNVSIRLGSGDAEPVLHEVKNKSAIFYAVELGDTDLINAVGEKIGWELPAKFKISAFKTYTYVNGKKYDVTFKSEAHTPSNWAKKIGRDNLVDMLKKKKM